MATQLELTGALLCILPAAPLVWLAFRATRRLKARPRWEVRVVSILAALLASDVLYARVVLPRSQHGPWSCSVCGVSEYRATIVGTCVARSPFSTDWLGECTMQDTSSTSDSVGSVHNHNWRPTGCHSRQHSFILYGDL